MEVYANRVGALLRISMHPADRKLCLSSEEPRQQRHIKQR